MAQNRRILIVDDQQDLREQMAKLLSRSSRKSETVSLVRQMRSRLLGLSPQAEQDADEEPERGGYEVDVASQGQEALEKVKQAVETGKPYALMFLDMRMPPGWDGMETAKRIREVDKLLEIVIMTAYADHDQETVAQSVGAPDKLLYIKKPFQSEEIFQLALCLTSKWSAEEDERLHKGWLEGLIKGMSRIKGLKADKPEDVCGSVLKAFLSFSGAQKGLIASLSDGKWKLAHAAGVDTSEASSYISGNSTKLSESRTAQSVGGKYLLPLKREGYSAVAVIYDAIPQGDPEWYKLLNLLVMTASDVLSSAAAQEEIRKGERLTAIAVAASKIAACCQDKVKDILSNANDAAAVEKSARELNAFIGRLSSFGPEKEPAKAAMIPLSKLLHELCAEIDGAAQAGIDVSTELSGVTTAEAFCPASALKDAFKAIAANRVAAAAQGGAKAVHFKFAVRAEGSAFKLSLEDDAPAVDASQKLFEPFSFACGTDSLGLALPLAKRLLKTAGVALSAETARPKGVLFTATLQSVPKV